ncbi:MAG TPA: fimbrial protein, partial [Herbaspirillum sp.]|nr:fimbrial protein [Herbaspirillum sp.]
MLTLVSSLRENEQRMPIKESASLFLIWMVLTLVGLLSCIAAQAKCKRGVYPTSPATDNGVSKLSFGRINITSMVLQHAGTILGSTVATAGNAVGINDETVLWRCDLADKDQLYEVFSTNGDDQFGGFHQIGLHDGMPGYYQTFFSYAAIKITHVRSGKVFSRYWQYEKLTNYDVEGNKILIRAKHLSPVQAELARVSTRKLLGGHSWCGNRMADERGGSPPYIYNCGAKTQPNAYITFSGPGYPADREGSDHATHHRFWPQNGVAFGMRNAAWVSYEPTCIVRNTTPEVTFWPITVQEFQWGEKREVDFSIQLECDHNVNSGTGQNQIAMGIQVSEEAYIKAMELGLVSSMGGVTHLLSNNYGVDPAIATGVGIRIRDAGSGQPMNFLGWQ